MKTLIIFDETDTVLNYAIVDGDLSQYDGIVINGVPENDEEKRKTHECINLMFDEKGHKKIQFSEDTSLVANKAWDKVAVITSIW